MIRMVRSVQSVEKIWNPQMIFDSHSVQAGVRNELGRVLVVSVLRREWNNRI